MSTITTNFGFQKPGADDSPSLPTWVGGLADDVDAALATIWNAGWTDFSSSLAWTASGTNPTKGASTTYSARWRLLNSHTVQDVVNISVGAGFSGGSGTYFWSLSHTPADSEGYGAMGSAFFTITGGEYVGDVRITTGKIVLYVPTQDGTTGAGHVIKSNQVTNTFGIAAGSGIRWSITYEI